VHNVSQNNRVRGQRLHLNTIFWSVFQEVRLAVWSRNICSRFIIR